MISTKKKYYLFAIPETLAMNQHNKWRNKWLVVVLLISFNVGTELRNWSQTNALVKEIKSHRFFI